MEAILSNFRQVSDRLTWLNARSVGAPTLVLLILALLVVPLPAFLLDVLFTFNIMLGLLMVMITLNTRKPLEFSSFPSVLLIATLLRLGLNVASTRVVLVEGHSGTDAAGKVIESFGEFVIAGNYVVGFIIFLILMIINFIVVTKGAGRVSEVIARFTLDAMPGKQMAIDADLNAGIIDQDTAKQRRNELSQESDFYGSMDGASKFVKGDAVAGILILVINIIGGIILGVVSHGLAIGEAAQTYIILAIGDTEQTSREGFAKNHLGDRTSLDLVGEQNDLFAAMKATGKPVIVCAINGRPPSYPAVVDGCNALLECWYPGQEGGTAMADILFGDVNPGAKLPVTVAVGELPPEIVAVALDRGRMEARRLRLCGLIDSAALSLEGQWRIETGGTPLALSEAG